MLDGGFWMYLYSTAPEILTILGDKPSQLLRLSTQAPETN